MHSGGQECFLLANFTPKQNSIIISFKNAHKDHDTCHPCQSIHIQVIISKVPKPIIENKDHFACFLSVFYFLLPFLSSDHNLYVTITMATKTFFKDIVKSTSLDFSYPEMQDITSAVHELVQRYAEKIAHQGLFPTYKLLPCGGMVEKTSLWKTYTPKTVYYEHISRFKSDPEREDLIDAFRYIEYDFLSLLEPDEHCAIKRTDCLGCMAVHGKYRWKTKRNQFNAIYLDKNIILPWEFNEKFRSELCKSIASLCSCISAKEYPQENAYKFLNRIGSATANCDKCTVYKATGYLQIDTSHKARFVTTEDPRKCAFMLMWTSTAKSLTAPNESILKPSEAITELHIFVDFLPAYELKEDLIAETATGEKGFIVPKKCTSCVLSHTWRVSYNATESYNILATMSVGHTNCYKTLKYMLERVFSWINSYHVKTCFLNHCKSCRKKDEAFDACVIETLRDLVTSYEKFHLETSVTKANMCVSKAETHYIQMLDELNAILKTLQIIDDKLQIESNDPSRKYSVKKCLQMLQDSIREGRENSKLNDLGRQACKENKQQMMAERVSCFDSFFEDFESDVYEDIRQQQEKAVKGVSSSDSFFEDFQTDVFESSRQQGEEKVKRISSFDSFFEDFQSDVYEHSQQQGEEIKLLDNHSD